jgi:hypothetical protein
VMLADGQGAVVRLVIVGAIKQDFPGLQAFKQTA